MEQDEPKKESTAWTFSAPVTNMVEMMKQTVKSDADKVLMQKILQNYER